MSSDYSRQRKNIIINLKNRKYKFYTNHTTYYNNNNKYPKEERIRLDFESLDNNFEKFMDHVENATKE